MMQTASVAVSIGLTLALIAAWPVANAAGLDECRLEKLDGSGIVDPLKIPGRFLYLDFWASWCGPCRQSFPFMNTLQAQYAARGVTVVAISVDKDPNEASAFLEAHPANFIVVRDVDDRCAKAMRVKGMPSSFVVTTDGRVTYSHVGFRAGDRDDIRQQLELVSAP